MPNKPLTGLLSPRIQVEQLQDENEMLMSKIRQLEQQLHHGGDLELEPSRSDTVSSSEVVPQILIPDQVRNQGRGFFFGGSKNINSMYQRFLAVWVVFSRNVYGDITVHSLFKYSTCLQHILFQDSSSLPDSGFVRSSPQSPPGQVLCKM